jgi:hypothetical protein
MPIAPDRVKKKIAALVFEKMRTPGMGDQMASANSSSMKAMSEYEPEEKAEDNGKLAVMAFWTACQNGDFESAWEALSQAVGCCKGM